jgi:hypothetical protein
MIIWLSSYPRSGNTFLRTILNHSFGVKTYSIYGDRFDIGADKATSEMIGHAELTAAFDYEEARKSEEMYFIKTHEPYGIKHEKDKAIYVFRDGREATVSFYHYFKNFSQVRLNYLQIINGQHFVGTWGNHFLSWLEKDKEDCLFLQFEKITADPDQAITDIASFTGLPILSRDLPGFDDLHKTNPKFFRSGKVNSFLAELSEFEQQYFWLTNGRAMRFAGYENNSLVSMDQHLRDELIFTHIQLTNQFTKDSLEQLKNQLALKDNLIKQKNEELKQKNEELKQKNKALKSASYRIGRIITWPMRKILHH